MRREVTVGQGLVSGVLRQSKSLVEGSSVKMSMKSGRLAATLGLGGDAQRAATQQLSAAQPPPRDVLRVIQWGVSAVAGQAGEGGLLAAR